MAPRGGFSSLVGTLSAAESAAQKELRTRVAALENQLRGLGVEPLRRPNADLEKVSGAAGLLSREELDLRLVREFLEDLGLGQYAALFEEQGYVELYAMLHMDEGHMKDLGMAPGHALKLKKKLEMQLQEARAKAFGGDAEVEAAFQSSARPGGARVCLPGIYRCVHGPRVAIRSAPSTTADTLDTLHRGDVIRVSEIVPPCWAKVDDDEIWARWTSSWPRRPRGVMTGDESALDDEDAELAEEDSKAPGVGAVPKHAFVLIEGAAVGISGPLLSRMPDDEAMKVDWPFRDALEARCAEMNAVHLRRQVSLASTLRQKFLDTALKYVGTPYHKRYHDPTSSKYLPGSQLMNSTRFLDNMQLIQQVVEDLKEDLGFLLIANCKPAYCFKALPIKLESLEECQPGDLIFYEGPDDATGRGRIVHVEVFLGGEGGKQSVGSLPWSSHSRTKGRDGVQVFDDFRIVDEGDWQIQRAHFCSLKPWLHSEETSFIHGKLLLGRSAAGGS